MQIEFENIFKRKDLFISIAILIACWPVVKYMNNFFQKKIDITIQRIEEGQKKKRILKELREIKKQLEEQASPLFAEDAQDVIDVVTSILKDYPDLKTVSLAPIGVFQKSEFFEKIVLRIKLKGTYSDLIKFLKDLESQDYYINVEKISISKVKNKKLEMDLKLLTFKIREKIL